MNELNLQNIVYTGISVDFLCENWKLTFGQLYFMLIGDIHPAYPLHEDKLPILSELDFEAVDDYWGIRGEDNNVILWLYPLINGLEVYHSEAPFDGIRLNYSILRNTVKHLSILTTAILKLNHSSTFRTIYNSRNLELGNPPNLEILEKDVINIVNYWRKQGVEPGSEQALKINY